MDGEIESIATYFSTKTENTKVVVTAIEIEKVGGATRIMHFQLPPDLKRSTIRG